MPPTGTTGTTGTRPGQPGLAGLVPEPFQIQRKRHRVISYYIKPMVYHEPCQIIPALNQQKIKSSKPATFGIASFSIPFCQKDRPKSQWAAATQVLCPQPQSCRCAVLAAPIARLISWIMISPILLGFW